MFIVIRRLIRNKHQSQLFDVYLHRPPTYQHFLLYLYLIYYFWMHPDMKWSLKYHHYQRYSQIPPHFTSRNNRTITIKVLSSSVLSPLKVPSLLFIESLIDQQWQNYSTLRRYIIKLIWIHMSTCVVSLSDQSNSLCLFLFSLVKFSFFLFQKYNISEMRISTQVSTSKFRWTCL